MSQSNPVTMPQSGSTAELPAGGEPSRDLGDAPAAQEHIHHIHEPPSAQVDELQHSQLSAAAETTASAFPAHTLPDDGVNALEVDSQPSEHDGDSALGVSMFGSSTTSVRESVYNFIEENGRTYHSYNQGKYNLPNDEAEKDRLDLQHQLFLLSLGSLHLAPIPKTIHNVLDLGTGTGIWAIDFAEQYPTAHVIGTDLSPIQPDFIPPNCHFEVSDFEEPWTYTQKFDYIHGRALTTCMRDPRVVLRSAFNALEPGGWLELQDPTMPFLSVDDSLEGTAVQKWMNLICTAGVKLGRSWVNSRNYKGWMEDIGFVDVVEIHFPWALNTWPRGKKEKLVALWMQQDLLDGLQGFSMRALVKGLGWSTEEVELLLMDVRKDIHNRQIHAYCDTIVVYGRKPT